MEQIEKLIKDYEKFLNNSESNYGMKKYIISEPFIYKSINFCISLEFVDNKIIQKIDTIYDKNFSLILKTLYTKLPPYEIVNHEITFEDLELKLLKICNKSFEFIDNLHMI